MSPWGRSSDSEDDVSVDVHFRHGSGVPSPAHRIETVARPRYYADPSAGHPGALIVPSGRTRVSSRSRSHERRSTVSSSAYMTPPPPSQAAGPIVINNHIHNDDSDSGSYSYSSDESDDENRRHRRRKSKSMSHSRRGRSRSRSSHHGASVVSSEKTTMTKEEWELEIARRDLRQMQVSTEAERKSIKDKQERERIRTEATQDAEYKRQKEYLQQKIDKEKQEKEEAELKRRWILEQKRKEEEEEEERKKRDQLAKEAVEKFQLEQARKADEERRSKEEWERRYKARLQADLIAAGVDEKDIQAILNREKVPDRKAEEDAKKRKEKENEKKDEVTHQCTTTVEITEVARPTYTRMSRRHLSLETLAQFNIEYEFDQDPEYVLIKRWVPEWEQDALWKHTKTLRESRKKVVYRVEDSHSHHHHHHHGHLLEPQLEVVRKRDRRKSRSRSRSRSPSPALLYLAGVRR